MQKQWDDVKLQGTWDFETNTGTFEVRFPDCQFSINLAAKTLAEVREESEIIANTLRKLDPENVKDALNAGLIDRLLTGEEDKKPTVDLKALMRKIMAQNEKSPSAANTATFE